MNTLYSKNNVLLLSLEYDRNLQVMTFVFWVYGVERKFTGTMHEDPEIRGLVYSETFDAFVMSLMPLDHKINSRLFKLAWAYVDGKAPEFPVVLISN